MLPEKILIEAWHGPSSTAAIAADLGVKSSELDLAFRQLKREGKLPKLSRQQVHQAEASSDRPAADEDGSTMIRVVNGLTCTPRASGSGAERQRGAAPWS